MSGNEIRPSDRTGIEREISGSFQTLMARTSSAPMMNVASARVPPEEGAGSVGEVVESVVGVGPSFCWDAATWLSNPAQTVNANRKQTCSGRRTQPFIAVRTKTAGELSFECALRFCIVFFVVISGRIDCRRLRLIRFALLGLNLGNRRFEVCGALKCRYWNRTDVPALAPGSVDDRGLTSLFKAAAGFHIISLHFNRH